MLERMLNAWTIRGWSVVAVAMVLALIAVAVSVITGVVLGASWAINNQPLALAAPVSAFAAWKIWRAFE